MFPIGWDKTYCLGLIDLTQYKEVHFFGDKTMKVCNNTHTLCMHTRTLYLQGGNDYEIFMDPRTIGHTVVSPENTLQLLKELFPYV